MRLIQICHHLCDQLLKTSETLALIGLNSVLCSERGDFSMDFMLRGNANVDPTPDQESVSQKHASQEVL